MAVAPAGRPTSYTTLGDTTDVRLKANDDNPVGLEPM